MGEILYQVGITRMDEGTSTFGPFFNLDDAVTEAKSIAYKRNRLGNKFKPVRQPTYGWLREWQCKKFDHSLWIKEVK